MSAPTPWPAIAAARATQADARLPFVVDGRSVGSVARIHLPALARHAFALRIEPDAVHLTVPRRHRDAALAEVHRDLHEQGLIVGWRDEIYLLPDPATLEPLALIERAAARFWGTLTFGAHCNGWVAGADGRPAALWIAERAASKATDPGKLDNLVGGGVSFGQSPWQTLLREAWEEAGLDAAALQGAHGGRTVRLARDVPEGLQHEWLYVWDLELPADRVPVNQDGEVASFRRLSVADALALAAGPEMTVDAACVSLDFALRHELLPVDEAEALAAAAAPLWVQPPGRGSSASLRTTQN